MDCVVIPVIVLYDFCIFNGKIIHENPINFSVALGNNRKGARYLDRRPKRSSLDDICTQF